ncbi:hypothetical protein PH505_ba00440 [Pseudoalteromonas distincta]|nr:hypothetical protein PH505_ba00440 [Pseudoalteromonas distincta]
MHNDRCKRRELKVFSHFIITPGLKVWGYKAPYLIGFL